MVVFYFNGTASSLMFTAIVSAAVRVVDDPGVAVAAPVPDGDVPPPVAVVPAAVGGMGRGRGSRGRGRGARG